MNRNSIRKMTAQVCTVTSVISILLLPVQAAEIAPPAPSLKPVLVSGALVPVPVSKPYGVSFQRTNNVTVPKTLEMMTLNVSRLFVSKTEISKQDVNVSALVKKEVTRKSQNAEEKSAKKISKTLQTAVRKLLRRGKNEEALKLVHKNFPQKPTVQTIGYDRMIAHIASAYLYKGQLNEAVALSEDALKRTSVMELPKASWVAGLALWQLKQPKKAAFHFENASISDSASDMMVASSAYWAARAHASLGNRTKKNDALKRAAHYPETFYGILALNTLGIASADIWDQSDYPEAKWTPRGGYRVEKSLINAIIRQESRFNPNAKSYSGARGLMQLMPDTAKYIAKVKGYGREFGSSSITDPRFNMKLGQDYVEYLFNHPHVEGDIVSMLIAYNAGPGNLRKWRSRISGYENDPLLLIEMLPAKETRDYVEHVMSNYWVYSMREGQTPPSIASLAQGQYHKYAAVTDILADQSIKVASN
jgi:soluble lytic murein transglycosylase-like protein